MPFRVLVLYLGNLYSLIIALLDRVNSMSAEVAPPHLSVCLSVTAVSGTVQSCPPTPGPLKVEREELAHVQGEVLRPGFVASECRCRVRAWPSGPSPPPATLVPSGPQLRRASPGRRQA